MREDYARFADSDQIYPWNLNPFALEEFIPVQATAPVHSGLEETTLDR